MSMMKEQFVIDESGNRTAVLLDIERYFELPEAQEELESIRFRKQKAFGCGRPRCLLCRYEKVFGIPSVKDRIRKQRFLDSLNDY